MSQFKILDGAMGTELINRGIILPEHIWSADANINQPNHVQQIHKDYIDAGADYLIANTFRTTSRAYAKANITGHGIVDSIYQAKTSLYNAVNLAKKAAGPSTKIIGSIAPLEDCYRPDLFPEKDIAKLEFLQLSKSLIESGIDIILLETMNSIVETEVGLISLGNYDCPIWVSFVLKNDNYLLSGDSLFDALNILQNYNVDMVLLNCNPLGRTMRAMNNIADNWPRNWGVYPNLGKGEPSPDGCIVEYETMEKFLFVIRHALELGASVVGACCGSSSEHIAEIKNLQNIY